MTNVVNMPSKEQLAELVRNNVDEDALVREMAKGKDGLEALDAFVEGEEDLRAMRDNLTNELQDETIRIVRNLTDTLANLHLGASMAIHSCRKTCNLDPNGTDETPELVGMLQYKSAQALINQVLEVNRQTALLEYIKGAGINYEVATNPDFLS